MTGDWASGSQVGWDYNSDTGNIGNKNQAVTDALKAGGTASDPKERQEQYDIANKLIWDEFPMLWLWDTKTR